MAEDAILTYLDKNELIVDSGEFAVEVGISHDEIVNAIKSLTYSKSVNAQDIKKESCKLTDEGKTYAAKRSPEYQLFMAIPPEGITIVELQKKLGDTIFKIGCQQANKNKWVQMGKSQASRKKHHADPWAAFYRNMLPKNMLMSDSFVYLLRYGTHKMASIDMLLKAMESYNIDPTKEVFSKLIYVGTILYVLV